MLETQDGLAPQSPGWYVVNARKLRWVGQAGMWRGPWFEAEDAPWTSLAFNVTVLDPGEPSGRYHGESNQEDFLVVSGECLLVVEGEERRLQQWDFFHCPPWTEHVLVGAGSGPAVVIAVSTRAPDQRVRYVANEVAGRYGGAPPRDTESAAEAYAGVPETSVLRYREGDLPG
jgi:quercetin dioxygenase-like cupin family protein